MPPCLSRKAFPGLSTRSAARPASRVCAISTIAAIPSAGERGDLQEYDAFKSNTHLALRLLEDRYLLRRSCAADYLSRRIFLHRRCDFSLPKRAILQGRQNTFSVGFAIL